jgi:hypothetical protein
MSRLKTLRVLTGSLNTREPGDGLPAEDAQKLENFVAEEDGLLRSRNGTDIVLTLNEAGEIHTIEFLGTMYLIGINDKLFNPSNLATPVVSGLSGRHVYIVAMNELVWIVDRNASYRYDGATLAPWIVAAPLAAPAPGPLTADANGLSGEYRFYVTFATAIDQAESNPGPASEFITLAGQIVEGFTGLPISSDPLTVKRHIYIEGGALVEAVRLLTVEDNVSTSTAEQVNADLLAEAVSAGLALSFEHDPPPSGLQGLVGPYFARLIGWKRNRLYWTSPNLPHYWPGADRVDGQWMDVGNSGDDILWVSLKARHMVIYKERSTYRLLGNPDTGYLELANPKMGIAGPQACASAGELDFFVASGGGVYKTTDGVRSVPVDEKINRTMRGDYSAHVIPVDLPRKQDFCLEWISGLLFLSYPEAHRSADPGNSATLILHEAAGRWSMVRLSEQLSDVSVARGGFTTIRYIGGDGSPWVGNHNRVLLLNQTPGVTATGFRDFNGLANMRVIYVSSAQDCGHPHKPKVFTEIMVDISTGGNNITLIVEANNGKTVYPIGTMRVVARTQLHFGLPAEGEEGIEAFNLTVRIDGVLDLANARVAIHGIYLRYYLESPWLDALTTIPFELAAGRYVEIKELQVDMDTSVGPAEISMWTDQPGNALAKKASSVPIATAATRRKHQVPLPAVIQGRLFRFAAKSLSAHADFGQFRIYGAQALARVLGAYLEGYEVAAGRVWDSMPQDLGSPLLKVWEELRFEMESDGALTVAFQTDLPGEAMAERHRSALTAGATTRAWRTVPMASVIEGRSGRLVVSGQQGFQIHKAQVRARVVGRYIAALNGVNAQDGFRTLEWDAGDERVKLYKRLEVDLASDGGATIHVYTNASGVMTRVYTTTVNTAGNRKTLKLGLPLNTRGRLLRIEVLSSQPVRLYRLRVWLRVTAVEATWAWANYPLEGSPELPEWVTLPLPEIPGTSDTWQWIDIPGVADPEVG